MNDTFDSNGNRITKRYAITIDAVSLLEGDAVVNDVESSAVANFEFQNMIRSLPSIFQKFAALAIEMGYQKNEVAFMMNKHPSTVTRLEQKSIEYLKVKVKKAMQEKSQNKP